MMPRIDPRALRGQIAASGLPRLNRLATDAKPQSKRIDPHLEAHARLRRELRTAYVTSAPGVTAVTKSVKRVEDSLPMVIVVSLAAEPWAGAEADLLGTAREMFPAHAIGLFSFGPVACSPDMAGADRVLVAPDGSEASQLATLIAVIGRYAPAHILFAEGDASGDLARRLAAKTGVAATFNVVQVKPGAVVSVTDGGTREVTSAAPVIVTLKRAACAALETDDRFEARELDVPVAASDARSFEDRGILSASAADLPLTEADLVMSAGAGLTDWDAFFAVAEGISAAVAGSRVVCDAGSLPRARQVGASGHIIEAKCYVAFGISGAPQHLQGIQACRHVIAVNTDPHAPIMARADLAIVADAQAVLKAFRNLIDLEAAR